MSSWAVKQRIKYATFSIGILVVFIGAIIFLLPEKQMTCFDGKQNQNELGIDCGGDCDTFCSFQIDDLVVIWSRAFPVGDGVYDVVARIRNPNFNAGTREAAYKVILYDENNILIAERRGETFINPSEEFVIFEESIEVKDTSRIPQRAFFEFIESTQWTRTAEKQPELIIRDEELDTEEARPKLRATITNRTNTTVRDIIVNSLLYDENDNVIEVSQTTVDILGVDESKRISFLWTKPFPKEPKRIEILMRVNAVPSR